MWPRSSVSHVTTISIVIIFSSQPNVSDKNLRASQENCTKTMNAFMNIATISIQSILAITFLKLALCSERPNRAGSAKPSANFGRAGSAEPSVNLAEPPSQKKSAIFC